MTARRCSVIGENGLQCTLWAYLDGDLCFPHEMRARKAKADLPPLGPPPRVTERFETRAASRTASNASSTSWSVPAPTSVSVAHRPEDEVPGEEPGAPLLVSNACSHGYRSWTECGECTNAADEDRGAL